MSTRRLSLRNDEGKVQTAALAGLVGIMIVAAVVALVLLSFSDSGAKGTGNQPADQAAAAQVTNTPKPTASAPVSTTPAAPTTSAAPSAKAPTSASAPVSTTPAAPTSSAAPATTAASGPTSTGKVITYTVKKGDNLTVISAWFHQHGYKLLYNWNKRVIGNDPNLILPGQKIIVSVDGKITGTAH